MAIDILLVIIDIEDLEGPELLQILVILNILVNENLLEIFLDVYLLHVLVIILIVIIVSDYHELGFAQLFETRVLVYKLVYMFRLLTTHNYLIT